MAWALTQSGFSAELAASMARLPGGAPVFMAISILAFIVLGSVLEGIPAIVGRLLLEKRHKEVTQLIKALLSKDNKDLVDALREQPKAIKDAFSAIIQSIPKPEKPEVNVEVNQQKIVTSLEAICEKIIKSNELVIKALNEKPLIESFDLQRDNWGNTKTVKVNYKK